GLAATLRQAQIAGAQRARAERHFEEVRRLASSFLFEFHDAIRNLPGATKPRQLIVRTATEYLDKLASEAAGDPVLQAELVSAYMQLASVAGETGESNLGDTSGAVQSCRKAVQLAEAFSLSPAATPAQRLSLAKAYSCFDMLPVPEAGAYLQRAF